MPQISTFFVEPFILSGKRLRALPLIQFRIEADAIRRAKRAAWAGAGAVVTRRLLDSGSGAMGNPEVVFEIGDVGGRRDAAAAGAPLEQR